MLVVFAGGEILPNISVYDNLASAIGVRLQKDRVHRRLRLQSACPSLCDLCPSDLASRAAWVGVVGHVLRLERGYPDAQPPQPRAYRGCHPAFSCMGGSAANENRASHEQRR